jgi:hypothetical protein
MSKPIHPLALFRLSVLGPLASRDHLERGELKKIISELASKTHRIPGVTSHAILDSLSQPILGRTLVNF